MKKIFFIFILIVTNALAAFAQKPSFVLNGHIDGIQTGKVKLLYGSNIKGVNINDSAIVTNGSFVIKGRLPNNYPHETLLWFNDSIPTNRFFVSAGSQSIHLDIHHFYTSPETNTKAGKENEVFEQGMQPVENRVHIFYNERQKIIDEKYHGNPPTHVMDSLKAALEKLSRAKDSVMLNFVRNNSKSYVALWHLFDRIRLMGYRPELEKAYHFLNNNVRNSSLGKLTWSYLYHSKILQPGAIFPALTLLSKDGKPIRLRPKEGNKITLIDFWYSHCSPCIAQFPDLKQFYAKYYPKGFEIISISTDKKSELKLWYNTIKEHQLPWPQYLDINAVAGPELGINIFPYNFIINDKGKIITEKVTMVQLQNILKKYFQDK